MGGTKRTRQLWDQALPACVMCGTKHGVIERMKVMETAAAAAAAAAAVLKA